MVIFGWDLMNRKEKIEGLYESLEDEANYRLRQYGRLLDVLGAELGLKWAWGELEKSEGGIGLSQKIDAICEHLNLEIVKETREEKVVCRKKEKK